MFIHTNFFYLKCIASFCTLIFLNFIIWISFHSAHHIFLNIDFVILSYQGHVNSDNFEHNHCETSSTSHKSHNQQSKSDCLFINFSSSSEKFLPKHLNKNIFKIFNDEKQNIYFNRCLINGNHFVQFSYFKRGPPKLEDFLNYI